MESEKRSEAIITLRIKDMLGETCGCSGSSKKVGRVSLKRKVDILNRVQSKSKALRCIKLEIFGIHEITALP